MGKKKKKKKKNTRKKGCRKKKKKKKKKMWGLMAMKPTHSFIYFLMFSKSDINIISCPLREALSKHSFLKECDTCQSHN